MDDTIAAWRDDGVTGGFVERQRCPACGGADFHELYRCPYDRPPIRSVLERRYAPFGPVDLSPLDGTDYVLAECQTCRLIFQQFIPDDDLMTLVYERWQPPEVSLEHKERNALASRGRNALEVMSVIDYFGGDAIRITVLDFGMGWGNWCRVAQAFGCETYGAEVSAARIDHAAAFGISAMTPERAADHTYDFINTEQVFEHLVDPLGTARLLAGTLKPNGVLKISVPNGHRVRRNLALGAWSAPKKSLRTLNAVSPLQHINCFVHQSLVALGEQASLVPVRIPTRLRYRYLPTWERPSSLLRRTVGLHYRAIRAQSTVVWFRRR
ncbi:MAG: class I SAM-dependent methyltransferase [Acidimicrobiales bacterium]